MPIRFKVFAGQSSDNLEDQVNQWLDEEEAKEVPVNETDDRGRRTHFAYKQHIKIYHFHTTLSDELIYLTLTYEVHRLRPVS